MSSNTILELKKYKKENPTDINNRVLLNKDSFSMSARISEYHKKLRYDILYTILGILMNNINSKQK